MGDIKSEDVQKAVEDIDKEVKLIIAYCDEFEQSFPKRMKSLQDDDDINHLCDDRGRIRLIKEYASRIKQEAGGISNRTLELFFK